MIKYREDVSQFKGGKNNNNTAQLYCYNYCNRARSLLNALTRMTIWDTKRGMIINHKTRFC